MGDQPGDAPPGIDRERATAWIAARVPELRAPCSFTLIAGGHSNLTHAVEDAAGRRWVLRRPPLGQVLATAHDMGREHRIISALAPTDVPVAPVVGYCDDLDVTGAPFYVMDFVDGTVVRDPHVAESLAVATRRRASESLVDVLARIHSVDVSAVGLADLGRHDGYVERQLRRWYGQYQGSKEQSPGLDIAQIDRVHDHLVRHVPAQRGVAIVHGDYRLDNCMLGADGSVAAVLDWEICTLGDPLADVGLLWVYWTDPGTDAALPQASPTAMEGFLRRDDILERYATASGRDLDGIDFYIAFGYWKLTCIIAGVYARYAGGAMGDADAEQVDGFRHMVETLGDLALDAANRVTA